MKTYKETEKLINQLKNTSGEEFDKKFKILLLEQLREMNDSLSSMKTSLIHLKK